MSMFMQHFLFGEYGIREKINCVKPEGYPASGLNIKFLELAINLEMVRYHHIKTQWVVSPVFT